MDEVKVGLVIAPIDYNDKNIFYRLFANGQLISERTLSGLEPNESILETNIFNCKDYKNLTLSIMNDKKKIKVKQFICDLYDFVIEDNVEIFVFKIKDVIISFNLIK